MCIVSLNGLGSGNTRQVYTPVCLNRVVKLRGSGSMHDDTRIAGIGI